MKDDNKGCLGLFLGLFNIARWGAMYNTNFPVFLDTIINVSDGLLAIVRNILVSIGIPTILILIIRVEIPRVAHGVEFLEDNSEFAFLTAAVVVIANKVIEFLIVYEQRKHGEEQKFYLFSVRLLFKGVIDLVFSKREASNSHRYVVMANYITATILLMALLGSMRTVIRDLGADEAWYIQIESILFNSSLQEMLVWTSGLALTATLVTIARGLAHYIAVHTSDVIDSLRDKRHNIVTTKKRVEENRFELEGEGYIIKVGANYTAYSEMDGWSKTGYTSLTSAQSGVRSHNVAMRKKEESL